MNHLLASPPSLRGRALSSLLGLLALSSLAGCGLGNGTPRIGVVDAALDNNGALHLVSRIEQGVSEGAETAFHGFAYTRLKDGSYESFSTSLGSGEVAEEGTRMYQIALDGQGRTVIAAEVDQGLVVQRFEDGQWKALPLDPSLSEDAKLNLANTGQLGSAWTASDGSVHVMYGRYIYKVKDAIFKQAALDKGCFLTEDCIFDPQGDEMGEAVSFSWNTVGFELLRLSCEGDCSWKSVGPIGSKDQGGSSQPLTRFFFHTIDGKGRFLQKIEAESGTGADAFKVIVSTQDEQITVFERGIYRVGGGPRPAGGFAVAALGYDRQLHLAAVGADGSQKTIDLGSSELGDGPIRVRAQGTSNEKVHVVTRESGDHLAHYVVSLPSGEFTKESISVAWTAAE